MKRWIDRVKCGSHQYAKCGPQFSDRPKWTRCSKTVTPSDGTDSKKEEMTGMEKIKQSTDVIFLGIFALMNQINDQLINHF